jgi:hypothetical protein
LPQWLADDMYDHPQFDGLDACHFSKSLSAAVNLNPYNLLINAN